MTGDFTPDAYGGEADVVRCDLHRGIAVLRVGEQHSSYLTGRACRELSAVLERLSADERVRGVVLTGAGADFGLGWHPVELSRVSAADAATSEASRLAMAIEGMQKPVAAALAGRTLGASLELAMACHGRVSLASAELGLPDIRRGIIPGVGGTQRLPRLVSIEPAMDMLLHGRSRGGVEAQELRLVDLTVTTDVLSAAVELVCGRKRRTVWRVTKWRQILGDPLHLAGEVSTALRRCPKPPVQPAAVAALGECVSASFQMDFEMGMKIERRAFLECVRSTASAQL